MNRKTLRITIQNESSHNITSNAIHDKIPVKQSNHVCFSGFDELSKILTAKRMELIRCIRQNNPRTVYELAKRLKRDVSNVSKDVQRLQELGLIQIRKDKSKGKNSKDSGFQVDYDRIMVSMDIRA